MNVLLMLRLDLNLVVGGHRQIKVLVMVFDVSLPISVHLLDEVDLCVLSISVIHSSNESNVIVFSYAPRVIELSPRMSVIIVVLSIIPI